MNLKQTLNYDISQLIPGRLDAERRRRFLLPKSQNERAIMLDCLLVLALLTRSNAPMPEGLTAAAEEEVRMRKSWGYERLGRLVSQTIAGILLLVLWAYISANPLLLILFAPTGAAIAYASGLTGGKKKEKLFRDLAAAMEQGATLSETMRRYPRYFPPYYTDTVEAAECSGKLPDCLTALCEKWFGDFFAFNRFASGMYFLAAQVVIALAITVLILIKIVPVFGEIAVELNLEVPWKIHFLLESSNFLLDRLNIIASLFGGGILAVALLWLQGMIGTALGKQGFFAHPLPSLPLRIPWVGGNWKRSYLGHAASVLAPLLEAGMTLPAALKRVAASSMPPDFLEAFTRIETRIEQGETFSSSCEAEQRRGILLPSFCAAVALGESSGMLPHALEAIAKEYKATLEGQLRALMQWAAPATVFAHGILVFFLASGLFESLIAIVDALNPP